MSQNNHLQLIIELDLQTDTMLKNNVTLEKALNWVRIRDDAVVQGILIGVDAPKSCMSDNQILLPGGFLARRRLPPKGEPTSSTREVFQVVQAGDPLGMVRNEGDIFKLVESLLKHTTSLDFSSYGFAISADSCLEHALKQSEAYLLQACCLFLQSECLEEDFHLCSVSKLLRSSEDDSVDLTVTSVMDILFHDLELRDPDHPAVSAYESFKTAAGLKIAEAALASCIHRLEHLNLFNLTGIIADMEAA